jgi:hypothetical protein
MAPPSQAWRWFTTWGLILLALAAIFGFLGYRACFGVALAAWPGVAVLEPAGSILALGGAFPYRSVSSLKLGPFLPPEWPSWEGF